MILLDREHLGLVDVDVERNGYGRQVASFEADLDLDGDGEPLRGRLHPRAARDGRRRGRRGAREPRRHAGAAARRVASSSPSFHPELTDDTRVHERFLELVREESRVRA